MTSRLVLASVSAALAATIVGCADDPPMAPSAVVADVAATLVFSQLSADADHACGITTDNAAWCWGDNQSGELGDGTMSQQLRPVAVAAGLRFLQVSAGDSATCAVTTIHRAWCWGSGTGGRLGDGFEAIRPVPVQVAGGHRFYQVSVGDFHTCGVSYPDRKAYCWGDNQLGELGDGTTTRRLTPVAVAGGRKFREVGAGRFFTCGLTTSNDAYCWGENNASQLGDGSDRPFRSRPVLVGGGHDFRQLSTGSDYACAINTAGKAFCWGNGGFGKLGDGAATNRSMPRAVSGGHKFDRLSASKFFTCGETTANLVYCWGDNSLGVYGDGTTTQRLVPVLGAGGMVFSQISAGAEIVCGRTPAGAGYCWGANESGQVGDGTTSPSRLSPTAIAGP